MAVSPSGISDAYSAGTAGSPERAISEFSESLRMSSLEWLRCLSITAAGVYFRGTLSCAIEAAGNIPGAAFKSALVSWTPSVTVNFKLSCPICFRAALATSSRSYRALKEEEK